jgi:hypothetical protein
MRVARERLIFFALSVLMTWAERAANEPVQPDISVRLALAFLFSCGRSRDRRSYDAFWKRLSDPGIKDGCQNDYIRRSYCHTSIKGIITDVGAPQTPEYWNSLFGATRQRHGATRSTETGEPL